MLAPFLLATCQSAHQRLQGKFPFTAHHEVDFGYGLKKRLPEHARAMGSPRHNAKVRSQSFEFADAVKRRGPLSQRQGEAVQVVPGFHEVSHRLVSRLPDGV